MNIITLWLKKHPAHWIAAAIALVTLVSFWPSLWNGFTNWDDHEYVLANPWIRACTVANLQAIWTQSRAASYQPLVFMTHMAEYRLWGLNPLGYHAVNLALHVITSLLVFRFLLLLAGARASARKADKEDAPSPALPAAEPSSWAVLCAAGLAAAWFGVHPLHVESVAWVAERKDVLCAVFFMLALCLYVRHVRQENEKIEPAPTDPTDQSPEAGNAAGLPDAAPYPRIRWRERAAAVVPRAAGAAPARVVRIARHDAAGAHSTIASPETPGRGSFRYGPWFWGAFAVYVLALLSKPMAVTWPLAAMLCDWYVGRKGRRRYWFEKAILFAPALVLVGLIFFIHASVDPQGGSLLYNLQMACRAFAYALWKLFAPYPLCSFYPRTDWRHIVPFYAALGIAALLLGPLMIWAVRRRAKTPVFALGWYGITFLPVSGIVTIGFVFTADRFMYLPSVGPLFAAASGAAFLIKRWPRSRRWLPAALAFATAALMTATWLRCGVWHDAESLWQDAAAKAPNHYTLRYLGMAQLEKGEYAAAEASMRASLKCSETQYGRFYMAEILRLQGRNREAMAWYEKFLVEQNWYVPALAGYGQSMMAIGDPSRAADIFVQCVNREPQSAVNKAFLGWALMEMGRMSEAETMFRAALALDPADLTANYNYGVLLMGGGRTAEAEKCYRLVLARAPDHQQALVNLGVTLGKQGRLEEARSLLRRALALHPDDAVAKTALDSLPGREKYPEK